MLLATVVNDSHKQNKGQNFAIKLKDSGSYQIGEIIDFDKLTLKNGHASLWANSRGYVQVSLKGDSLDAR